MLVVLRLALGWHFLYEGIWKLTHRDAFVAETEGFLSNARGPAAKLIYRMVPDIDGHERLEQGLTLVQAAGKEADGKQEKQPQLAEHWKELTRSFVAFYKPAGDRSEREFDRYLQLAAAADKVCQRHVRGLEEFAEENGGKINAHFESLRRYKQALKSDPRVDFLGQRRWDEMQELRKEAKGWLADLAAREKALKADLMNLLSSERLREVEAVAAADAKGQEAAKAQELKSAAATLKADLSNVKVADKNAPAQGNGLEILSGEFDANGKTKRVVETKPSDPPRDRSVATAGGKSAVQKDAKPKAAADGKETNVDFSPLAEGHDPAGPFRASSNPLDWTRIEQLSFVLTYALLAIGACLMLGLFTRLSGLAGAAFMLTVVLSQPSYPGVYPPDPSQMGHALLVNKDFVEMIALLVIASTKLGRWTGLDFFLHYCLVRPFCRCCGCCKGEGE